jgi:Lar family restriction alleviation protein
MKEISQGLSPSNHTLKPCPFCGEKEYLVVERTGNYRRSCIIRCDNCSASLESNEIGSGDMWNQRNTDDLIEDYKKIVEKYTPYDVDIDSEKLYNCSDEDFYDKGELRGKLNQLKLIIEDLKKW